jgi:hypothetical protein
MGKTSTFYFIGFSQISSAVNPRHTVQKLFASLRICSGSPIAGLTMREALDINKSFKALESMIKIFYVSIDFYVSIERTNPMNYQRRDSEHGC